MVPNWMVRDEAFTTHAIAVWVALASHSGRGGIRPSQATLAVEARCSERRVRDALVELRDAGVLAWTTVAGPRGRQNVYTLHPNGLPEGPAGDAAPMRQDMPDGSGTTCRTGPAPRAGEEEPDKQEPIKKNPPAPSGEVNAAEYAYAAWPKKVQRKDAITAFERAARRRPAGELLADVCRFANAYAEHVETRFVPALGVWIRGERWTDELPTAPETRRPVTAVEDRKVTQGRAVHDELVRQERQALAELHDRRADQERRGELPSPFDLGEIGRLP